MGKSLSHLIPYSNSFRGNKGWSWDTDHEETLLIFLLLLENSVAFLIHLRPIWLEMGIIYTCLGLSIQLVIKKMTQKPCPQYNEWKQFLNSVSVYLGYSKFYQIEKHWPVPPSFKLLQDYSVQWTGSWRWSCSVCFCYDRILKTWSCVKNRGDVLSHSSGGCEVPGYGAGIPQLLVRTSCFG